MLCDQTELLLETLGQVKAQNMSGLIEQSFCHLLSTENSECRTGPRMFCDHVRQVNAI